MPIKACWVVQISLQSAGKLYLYNYGNHYQTNRDCIIIMAWNIYVAYHYRKRCELLIAPNEWQKKLHVMPHNDVVS